MPVVRWYCPECRKTELRWRRRHRSPLGEDFDPVTGEWQPRPAETVPPKLMS